MDLLIMIILAIVGMPFFGVYLMVAPSQKGNRGLGLALFIVGLMIHVMIKAR